MTIVRKPLLILCLPLAFIFLGGCETTKQDVGSLVGLVVGAAVGAAIGTDLGIGDAAGTVVGGFAGSIIGNSIGQKLDEEDRLKAAQATAASLTMPKGETVEWESTKNKGVRGQATPVSKPVQKAGNICRNVREIVVIDGEETSENTEYCKSGDSGKWRLSS